MQRRVWNLFSLLWPGRLPRLTQRRAPAVPAGTRIYAIGDVHGRLDLLDRLLRLIREDNAARPPATVQTVLLGDVIDRGPDSAALLREFATGLPAGTICLRGNHEAALVHAWRGEMAALRLWLQHGGRATLRGFGATEAELDGSEVEQHALVRRLIPRGSIDWLASLPLSHGCGDYLFVHAGVRPGVRLSRQRPHDLLWIRDDFLTSERWHGKVIVHGHTPARDVAFHHNRIGIDTGAYYSGTLTALALEGAERWLLQT